MKKFALAGAVALALLVTACKPDAATIATVCARENTLHTIYMAYIAPNRPADRVAKASAFHIKVQNLCLISEDIAELLAAVRAADAARSD